MSTPSAGDAFVTCRIGDKQGQVPGKSMCRKTPHFDAQPCWVASYLGENTTTIDNPVHEAAKRGNVGFLQDLINAGVSVNSTASSSVHAITAHG